MSIFTEVRIMALKLPWILSVLAVLGACAQTSYSGGRADPAAAVEGQHVPGELLVHFRPGVAQVRISEILAANGLRIERELGMPRAYLVKSADACPIYEIIARLRSYPEVESAEPNWVRRIGPPSPAVPAKPSPNSERAPAAGQ
jgi:hypothetical protein